MKIPESAIEEVLQRADIVEIARDFHIELKKAGDNTFKACCPFHNEKTPSFHISVAKQAYHCFGCGAGGGLVHFVKAMLSTDFPGAIRWLADRYHVDIPDYPDENPAVADERHRNEESGKKLLDETAGFFQSALTSPEGRAAREYLAARGIDEETIRTYRLGFAPDSWNAATNWALGRGFPRNLLTETGISIAKESNPDHLYDRWRNRIIFPICDDLARVVGFSGRVFQDRPNEGGKYVNSPESSFFHKSKILYGYHIARLAFKNAPWALVCEGQLDVIACHRAGLKQAVAAQGTAFTEDHAVLFKRNGVRCVHLAFDGDAAGMKATLRTIGLLLQQGIQVEITQLPDGEDPDSIFRRGGASALQQVMGVSTPAIDFAYRHALALHPQGTPEAKSAIVHEMIELIAQIPDEVTAYGHCQQLAKLLDLPDRILADQLAKRKREYIDQRSREFVRKDSRNPSGVSQLDIKESPTFHLMAANASIAELIFNLASHFQPIAEHWMELDLTELLPPDIPIVRAIHKILTGTAAGDWQGALEEVTQGELAEDSLVSKILVDTTFDDCTIDEKNGTLSEPLEKALADCERRLEQMKLEKKQHELQRQMADDNAIDPFTALKNAQEIALKKQQLKNR